jgi:hypothetical protein
MPASPESKTIWPAPAQAVRQAVAQQGVLRRPADEVGEPAPRRLKAALGCGDAFDHEGFDRFGEALDRLAPEVAQPEQVADQAAGGAGEDDLSGFGKSLQACSEVGGLADHGLLLCRAFADQITDDDKPGGNADADGEPLRSTGLQPRHGRFYLQPGTHRPLGIVLMRPRITEIGQHPVAHELSDKAVIARDAAGNGVLIGAELLAQFLGVEPRRQGRRADEIAKHDRQLPPLGHGRTALLARRRNGRRRRSGECGNRIEQATPVTDQGNAEILQVIGRQTRQHLLVDVVFAESLLVPLQPEPPQPAPNVHRVVPALVFGA